MLGGLIKNKAGKKIYWYNWSCILGTMSDNKLHRFLYTQVLPDWPHHRNENQPVCWDPESDETHHVFLDEFMNVDTTNCVPALLFRRKAHKYDYVAMERDWDTLKHQHDAYKYIVE
jgi:hypothetical protein